MEGITILNSYECFTNSFSIFMMIGFCITFIIGAAIVLFTLVEYGCDTWKEHALLVACIACAIIIACLIPEEKYETYYQVTIDDSVSMNEFTSKYEVVKQEGSIYTIIEKTNEG